jgi:tRNA 2-selenouridine synthase
MNPVILSRLADAEASAHGHDCVIDVRSPAEFDDDHLPGAINLPVLDNAEHALVGTIYKQQSAFAARKVGAALVARNAARHIEGALAHHDKSWRPLVYCWRGGQRSGAFATILSNIGWRVGVVEGGYKTWRRLVTQVLDTPVVHRLLLLDGNTGTAKTAVLGRLASCGAQVVDLESLAHHRGSLFGHHALAQPSQRSFESSVARALSSADMSRVLFLEAESARIGVLHLPGRLRSAMLAGISSPER